MKLGGREAGREIQPTAPGAVRSCGVRRRLAVSSGGRDGQEVLKEFVQSGAGDDDRIAPAVGFFADTEESTARILAVVDR